MIRLQRMVWRFALVAAALVTLAIARTSAVRGQASQPTNVPAPSFAVASIKPNDSDAGYSRLDAGDGRFFASNVTAETLIEYAYGMGRYDLMDNDISGGPNWIGSKRYDVEAKAEAKS